MRPSIRDFIFGLRRRLRTLDDGACNSQSCSAICQSSPHQQQPYRMRRLAGLQECTQMQELQHCAGLPASTQHITQPLLQRQVFLRTSDGASNGVKEGTALVYAASWWNADAAHRYLQDESLPIWASLSRGKTELYRDIQAVFLGHSPVLEERFGRKGPFWGRQYLFWHDRKPLTLIHEVFSTSLEHYLGPSRASEP